MESKDFTALPRKILVGLAFDDEKALHPADREVLERAIYLAGRFGSELVLAHAIDVDADEIESEDHQALLGSVDRAMQNLLSDISARGVSASVEIGTGRPWHALIQLAHKTGADWIAIGPLVHRPNFLERLRHGSTAGRLIRKSHLPVLRVHGGAVSGYKTLLLAVDQSSVATSLAGLVHTLGEKLEAARHLVHSVDHPHDIIMHRKADPREALARYHKEARDKAHAFVNQLLSTAGGTEAWEVHVKDDEWIHSAAPNLIKEHGIDLLIISGVSATTIVGHLLGGTAEKILEACDVDALIVKPPGWKSPLVFDE